MPDPAVTPAPAIITVDSLGAVQGDAFRALLPADVQTKPYAKNLNTFTDLVKGFDGAQSLLGQRAMPDANSTPEQWMEFHGKTRPESAEKYTFGKAEGVTDEYITKANGLVKKLQGILFSGGASVHQGNVIIPAILKELATAETAFSSANDQKFSQLATQLFGGQKDAVIANGKKYLAAHLPDNMKPLLETMDEKQLTVVLAATDVMAKKFTGEDPFRGGGGGGGGGGGETKEQLVMQMQTIMKDPSWSDPFKDKVKHADLNQKMDVIRGKLKKLQGGV